MSTTVKQPGRDRPATGEIGYLQLPALDVGRSAAFYQAVFGWQVELERGSFEAPGVIGQLTTGTSPAAGRVCKLKNVGNRSPLNGTRRSPGSSSAGMFSP